MKIILLSPIAPEATRELQARHDLVPAIETHEEDLPPLLTDREAIVLRSGVRLTEEVLRAAPALRLIVRAGSGIDNIDLEAASRRGIRVVRVPGPSAQAVAELTFALILAVVRKVALADRNMRQGRWPKHQLGGHLLRGKTLGIVGAGSIGSRVGELGAAWRMRVLGCVPRPTEARRLACAALGITLVDLEAVVGAADILSLHTPLDATTRNLVDAGFLARMKPGAYLINTARGGVVDEAALRDALERGHLAGAALDVHATERDGTIPPLAELSNVVLTPHIGGMALESQKEIGERIVEIVDVFEASADLPLMEDVVAVA
jgi:D-3-phosphoglycerate dehydrogenase / 2-oxoglutarate reductase